MNLTNGIKITKVKAASATATTAVTSSVIDMAGYEGVVFFTAIGTANAGNYIKAQQDSVVGMGSAADLEGSKVVATADGEVVWLDIYRPQERFIQVVVTRGATTVLGEIYALQYESRLEPIDNTITSTIIGKLLISPSEGTA